jgi:hypothetical protein
MESLKEQFLLAQLQHDKFVELLQKEQGEEMAQQKSSLVKSSPEVQELRKEYQQLVANSRDSKGSLTNDYGISERRSFKCTVTA